MLRVHDRNDAGPVDEEVDEVCRRLRNGDHPANAIELSRIDSPWPMLSVLISGEWCVLHLTTAKHGRLFTLEGATASDFPEEVEFLNSGTPTVFTRDYINTLATAEAIIRAFGVNSPWPESANWDEL
jgi:hypothetical protein